MDRIELIMMRWVMRFVLPHGLDRMDNDEVGAVLWMR